MKQICKIKGFENIKEGYYVTESGKILSYCNLHGGIKENYRELKQYKKTGGYLNVCLVDKNNKSIYFRVHRIVCSAFKENPLNKPYVNHIDENRTNNNIINLEWVTPKENNLHSISKKMYVYDKEGNLIKKYKYAGECEIDGFNKGHAMAVARGKERTHKNLIFSYELLNKCDIVQRLSKAYPRKDRSK